jgi:pimeloyl-ACP methyl ester carboxylesterase
MKTILLLHGALGSKEQVLPLADKLSHEYDVHTFDFSGHGMKSSATHEFGIESMANELEIYINQYKISKPIVFGYSMGGYVALYHAFKYPNKIQKIITLATKFDWTPENAERESGQLDVEMMKLKIPEFVNALKLKHGNHWEQVVSKTAKMMQALGKMKPLDDKTLALIYTETLILIGDKDKMVSVAESQNATENLPNGALKILKDTPHPFERVDFFKLSEIIKEFTEQK